MNILAIDPGLTGALVFLSEKDFKSFDMPIIKTGKDKQIDFNGIRRILKQFPEAHIFLERAMPLAMGAKHAFNYGRGFAALEIAIQLSGNPVTYVEPAKWCKVMHEGISNDLKPKAKSEIAIRRLCKNYIPKIPTNKNGKMHEGVVDALLLARYGVRILGG